MKARPCFVVYSSRKLHVLCNSEKEQGTKETMVKAGLGLWLKRSVLPTIKAQHSAIFRNSRQQLSIHSNTNMVEVQKILRSQDTSTSDNHHERERTAWTCCFLPAKTHSVLFTCTPSRFSLSLTLTKCLTKCVTAAWSLKNKKCILCCLAQWRHSHKHTH